MRPSFLKLRESVGQYSEAESEDEMEFADNLFDALCCCLLIPTAKKTFLQADSCVDRRMTVAEGPVLCRTAESKCVWTLSRGERPCGRAA